MSHHIVHSNISGVQETQFRQQLLGLLSNFSRYEDPRNREIALRYIPVDELTQIAEAKGSSCIDRTVVENVTNSIDSDSVRDLLLLELLRWFKEEFFSWTDKPRCPRCSNVTEALPNDKGIPTPEERLKSASRVEVYFCTVCSTEESKQIVRFPRYNDPVVLLETRTGRCGEWANCFALICRAMNFEIRHATDWSDHVWVEVFSAAQNRWLHCDPCENKCDTPLLYEIGWGKQISYVIAVSHDDIQDVTWRYSHSDNHMRVRASRTVVDERWLIKTILELRKMRQRGCSPERFSVLQGRLVTELVEFICPTKDKIKDSELGGRESGSLAWRLARQEVQVNGSVNKSFKKFTWKITREIAAKHEKSLEFFYDPSKDEYFLGRERDKDMEQRHTGWQSTLFEVENISRKEEKDWKMVYLARNENQGGQPGKLSWKFEVEDTGICIHSVQLHVPYSAFHSSTSISLEVVTSTGMRKAIPDSAFDNGMCKFTFRLKPEVRWFTIECTLSGGTGSISWQQMQLFRESLETKQKEPHDPTLSPFLTLRITELVEI